jgi:hypothetical protein
MENSIDSNTVWCIGALLAFVLIIVASVQAWMGVRPKVLNDTSDCCSGGSWRNDMTFITTRANAVHMPGMISGRVQLLPRNPATCLTRVPAAPNHGKEYTPC